MICNLKLEYQGQKRGVRKMGVWNGSQTIWDSFQTSVINVKNLSFIVSGTLHARTSLCLHVHASWPYVQVDSCVCRQRVPWLYFSKNRFICSLKIIFSILTFQHHWETRARVIRSTKCSVYKNTVIFWARKHKFWKNMYLCRCKPGV